MHAPHELRQAIQRQHMFFVDLLADFGRIGVECGHDVQTALLESGIAQQGSAEAAGTDQECLVNVVPAEELLNGGQQLNDGITHLGPADDSRNFNVFAYLSRIESQLFADVGAGDGDDALLL